MLFDLRDQLPGTVKLFFQPSEEGAPLGEEGIRQQYLAQCQAMLNLVNSLSDEELYSDRIFVWLAAYRSGGWDALRSRKASGRPKRLTGAQLKWIYNTVTTKNPLQLRFPFALWTRAMIQMLIRRKYGIKLSAVSVGRLLAQMGLSCQKPLSRAFEQDASLIKRWMERDFPKLRALAKKEHAVIFFSDESGVRSDFHAGTTWGIRGKTPVVAHTGKRFHLNMLSAISAKGELRFMTSRKRISATLFIDFLRRLITNYPRKIFLVVDGLPAHKAKSVQRFLAGMKGRLRLFFLPPYSPDFNPIEKLWLLIKAEWFSDFVAKDRDALVARLDQALNWAM